MVERPGCDDREAETRGRFGRDALLGHLGQRVRTDREQRGILSQGEVLGLHHAVHVGGAAHQHDGADAHGTQGFKERHRAADIDAKGFHRIDAGIGRERHARKVDDGIRSPARVVEPAHQAGLVGDVEHIGAGSSDNLVAVVSELGPQPTACEAGCAGDEDPHSASGVACGKSHVQPWNRVTPEALDVGIHHHPHQLLELDRWLPAEVRSGLGRVPQEVIHFGRPVQALVYYDVLLVVEADVLECYPAQVPDRMGNASCDYVVIGYWLLHHRPHGVHVIAGEAPVALRLHVAHSQIVRKAQVDPSDAI